jgi:hypothetical protein
MALLYNINQQKYIGGHWALSLRIPEKYCNLSNEIICILMLVKDDGTNQFTSKISGASRGYGRTETPVPEFIDPRFRENQPKTLVFSH